MTQKTEGSHYIKIFFLIVIVAALVSLIFKGFVQIRDSTFKYSTFNFLLLDRDAYFVHVDTTEKKLSVLKFPGKGSVFARKGRIGTSVALTLPVEAVLAAQKENSFSQVESQFVSFPFLLQTLFSSDSYRFEKLNFFDLVKVFFVAARFEDSKRRVEEIMDFDENKFYERDFSNNFYDKRIFNEKASVKIVNATEIDGLAARFARILENLGYNVIAIESSEAGKSQIATNKQDSVSTKRLRDFLEFELSSTKEESAITDITVVLGKDLRKQLE